MLAIYGRSHRVSLTGLLGDGDEGMILPVMTLLVIDRSLAME